MTVGALAIVALTALFAFSLTRPAVKLARVPVSRSLNPVDEAARILAARYTSGALSAGEYERMLTALRN